MARITAEMMKPLLLSCVIALSLSACQFQHTTKQPVTAKEKAVAYCRDAVFGLHGFGSQVESGLAHCVVQRTKEYETGQK